MNIIERAREFVESQRALAKRGAKEWRRCPRCGGTETYKNGGYWRYPWTLQGREAVWVPRHQCKQCHRSYSERSARLVVKGWYAREVRRMAVDQCQHAGSSLRRAAEWVRSMVGQQERWLQWCVLRERDAGRALCHLGASSVQRWLDGAGKKAQATVAGQLEGIVSPAQLGTDGMWARLRGGMQRVVLALTDSVSGVLFPPVVVEGEESAVGWEQLFARAQEAGLNLAGVLGLTSDGAQGLIAYLKAALQWVNQQRCIFHVWRNLGGELARAVAKATHGLSKELTREVGQRTREELVALIHAVLDAPHDAQAEQALQQLQRHAQGAQLAKKLSAQLDRLLVHRLKEQHGLLLRVGPEWLWRDFRLRLSRGRNHGSERRLERAALVWAIYRNFTPAQWRCERKRHYRRPGKSPLEMAGATLGELSYLDALGL
jgi:transposase-like protein